MVKPKKHLGQHFLTNEQVAENIASSLEHTQRVVEIGPGTGKLTEMLLKQGVEELLLVETDSDIGEP